MDDFVIVLSENEICSIGSEVPDELEPEPELTHEDQNTLPLPSPSPSPSPSLGPDKDPNCWMKCLVAVSSCCLFCRCVPKLRIGIKHR